MNKKHFSLFVMLTLSLGSLVYPVASRAQPSKVVRYAIDTLRSVQQGDTLAVTLSFDVAPDWFVHAPSKANKIQRMMITQAKLGKLPAGINLLRPPAPPRSQFYQGHEVYMGRDNRFMFSFSTEATLSPGTYPITITFTYQACDPLQCLLPVTENIVVKVIVNQ